MLAPPGLPIALLLKTTAAAGHRGPQKWAEILLLEAQLSLALLKQKTGRKPRSKRQWFWAGFLRQQDVGTDSNCVWVWGNVHPGAGILWQTAVWLERCGGNERPWRLEPILAVLPPGPPTASSIPTPPRLFILCPSLTYASER